MSNAIQTSWRRLATVLSEARQQAEDAVSCEELLSPRELQLLSSMPGMVSVHAAKGALVWGKGHFCQTGTPSRRYTDLGFLENVNPQDHPALLEAIRNAGRGEKTVRIRIRQSAGSGCINTRTLDVSCSNYTPETPVFEEPLVLVLLNDVTDQLEAAVEAQAEAEATQEKLRERNELFAAASHELRTPLNAILGFSELLEGKAAIRLSDDKRLEYAGLINQSANHLLKLINGVLDLSKLEAGKNEVNATEFCVADVMRMTTQMLTPLAARRSVILSNDHDEFLPQVRSDEQMLTQIFTNLLSNAIKFSKDGGEVTTCVKRRRNHIEVMVRDRGLGMSEETVRNLGGAFFQAGPAITRDYGGTGLGLAIAYQQISQLGGTISVESILGEGSLFTLTIPLQTGKPKPVAAEPGAEIVYLNREAALELGDKLPMNTNRG